MREALFIKKNKERWDAIRDYPSSQPDEMAEEFTQLTDDLGFAKTFYPHSKVTRYLNTEASRRYLRIYHNRKEEHNKFVVFFKYKVPLTLAKHQYVLLLCFALFTLFFCVGFFSSMYDPSLMRDVLGDSYVEMTYNNIEKGNPFGVYQSGNSFIVGLGIMVNNISVALRFLLEGLPACFFSIKDLAEQSVMVGAFDYMFYEKGYGGMFILTVMIHGTLELSGLVIAAAAGVVLGKSWIFPGTVSRLQALKTGAKDAVVIMTALLPVFAMAAFFEGFVTRYYRMPVWMSLLILLSSATYIIGYFVVYPIRLKKKLAQQHAEQA